MPLLEVILPATVFGLMFTFWILLPPRPGEVDFGSKIRDRFRRALRGPR